MNIFLAGVALALLWPRKGGTYAAGNDARFEGPDVDPYNGSALGTFAPKGEVVDPGDNFSVTHIPAGRNYQP